MGAAPKCTGCTECGTTLADHPDWHADTEPHDWRVTYDRYTGLPVEMECRKCHRTERLDPEQHPLPINQNCTGVQHDKD
jgi:hypothetical protein